MSLQEKNYTIRQVSKILPLTVETIRRYCREGKIKPIRVIGNRILIPESTLSQFLASHTIGAD